MNLVCLRSGKFTVLLSGEFCIKMHSCFREHSVHISKRFVLQFIGTTIHSYYIVSKSKVLMDRKKITLIVSAKERYAINLFTDIARGEFVSN